MKAPIIGPAAKPRKNTPVRRENMCDLEPSDVQSETYAEVAPCNVDHPPSKPSMIGEMMRSLCPCVASGEPGSDTRMNIKSVRSHPSVLAARTRVRPWRSPKCPHQPVVMAERVPIVVVMIICKRAAPAWTAGSWAHRFVGRCVGSSGSPHPSLSSSFPARVEVVNELCGEKVLRSNLLVEND